MKTKTGGIIQHLAIDAIGLKVYGEGEWKVNKRGTDRKRRVWRKLHEGAAFWEQGYPQNLAVGCHKLYGFNKKWKSSMAIISAHYQKRPCIKRNSY